SYLIPGDRVDVGFLCGEWAYIRYPRPNNARNDISGWVPTKRLYAVDPLVSVDSGMAARYYRQYVGNDDLVLAVLTGDIGDVKGLLV
ncbi:MAG TPA: hypothetical protein VE218_09085, partial [Acidobacteriaceae bacterium]|nr:hypothetical protein [Acidobacteriaceae bacterium]